MSADLRRPNVVRTLTALAAVVVLATGGAAAVATTASAQPRPAAMVHGAEHAQDADHAPLHGQTPVVGFFRGHEVSYLDEGPIALATDKAGHFVSDVDPIWVVTNGAQGQHNIIDNVPGLNSPNDYTPLWQVVKVTWVGGHPELLRSAAQVQRAVAAGRVTLQTTMTVVNCPVL